MRLAAREEGRASPGRLVRSRGPMRVWWLCGVEGRVVRLRYIPSEEERVGVPVTRLRLGVRFQIRIGVHRSGRRGSRRRGGCGCGLGVFADTGVGDVIGQVDHVDATRFKSTSVGGGCFSVVLFCPDVVSCTSLQDVKKLFQRPT